MSESSNSRDAVESVALKNNTKYKNGVPILSNAKKEMGNLHANTKSLATGRLGKHLSAPAWAILYHSTAWASWDKCEYKNGTRSIGTALALDRRQVQRGLGELVDLGIFKPKERSIKFDKREAQTYIVGLPNRNNEGELLSFDGKLAPRKHEGRACRNSKSPKSSTPKVKKKTKSVAIIQAELKVIKEKQAEQKRKAAKEKQEQQEQMIRAQLEVNRQKVEAAAKAKAELDEPRRVKAAEAAEKEAKEKAVWDAEYNAVYEHDERWLAMSEADRETERIERRARDIQLEDFYQRSIQNQAVRIQARRKVKAAEAGKIPTLQQAKDKASWDAAYNAYNKNEPRWLAMSEAERETERTERRAMDIQLEEFWKRWEKKS